jgi:hypothetical protein
MAGVDRFVDALTRDQGLGFATMPHVILSLAVALAGGMVLAWVYMFTHTSLSYSRSFVNSLIVIPVIVALVMMVMVDNFITAFGLMAVFAIVRFRNIVRDTLDTAHILCVLVVGMAAGTQKYTLAVIGCLGTAAIMLFLWWTEFGARQRYDLILNFHWGLPLGDVAPVVQVLRRHGDRIQCAGQRTDATGAGADLSYRLLLRDPQRVAELVAELERTDGVSRVVSLLAEDESEV